MDRRGDVLCQSKREEEKCKDVKKKDLRFKGKWRILGLLLITIEVEITS